MPGPRLGTAGTSDASPTPSRPRVSAACGSCGIHSALCSTPPTLPDGYGSDRCLAPSEESGRHAAHSPDPGHVKCRPSGGAPKASELFLSMSCSIVLSRLKLATSCFNRLFSPGATSSAGPGLCPDQHTASSTDRRSARLSPFCESPPPPAPSALPVSTRPQSAQQKIASSSRKVSLSVRG